MAGRSLGQSGTRRMLAASAVLASIFMMADAAAVPSFARQTGFECVACHLSWPELTTVGRQFKLGGFTLTKPAASGERPLVSFSQDGEPPLVPLAARCVPGIASQPCPTTPSSRSTSAAPT